jgi:hypothetical protein
VNGGDKASTKAESINSKAAMRKVETPAAKDSSKEGKEIKEVKNVDVERVDEDTAALRVKKEIKKRDHFNDANYDWWTKYYATIKDKEVVITRFE